MNKYCLQILLFCAIFGLCGCSMGIYSDSYTCPQNEKGECLPLEDAYEKAISAAAQTQANGRVITDFIVDPIEEQEFLLGEVKNFEADLFAYDKCLQKKKNSKDCEEERDRVLSKYRTAEDRGRAKEIHGANMQERVTKLAAMQAIVNNGTNTVPIRQPDTLMEVVIMPYVTPFGALVSERVIWVVVDEGQWTWATNIGALGSSQPKIGETR